MRKKQYPAVQANPDFPVIERKILEYWANNDIFQKSIKNRKNAAEFVFYDGPPFANGLPHYGHLLTGFVKDVYARYQTLKGKAVERRFGWDCHGLPAEMQAEKELGFSGSIAIKEFGIDKFNEHCKTSVMKYTSQWERYVTRQARWVDFINSYKTMDIDFMESVLWAFKELYKKGYVYEAMKVMPYSWACETPLSNFETRLDNSYRERADKAISVSFILQDKPQAIYGNYKEYRAIAWTTTPWTLPSNLALAVGTDIEYSIVPKGDICYILGRFALAYYAKELEIDPNLEFQSLRGSDLAGLRYKPLFSYFANHVGAFKILTGGFVTEGDGTGIVHMAPAFGEDDYDLCSANGIKLVCPVDNAGKFTNEVEDLAGIQVFEANDLIIAKLKSQGNWIKTEQYIHNYPHCWRTDTPLIYKAVSSWYVKVTAFKDRMCELNQQINWIPGHIKDGIFGKWLENARDWSISRKRFWGTPIPIWKSDNPAYPRIDVYGSIAELERDFGVKINDLHRQFLDKLTRPNPDDKTGKSTMRRVEDVFDCWFESGAMPYAQAHYPFENKEWFDNHFPADFIVEYVAQTRGWFYTMMVLSTALFNRPPFLNCICHGVVLDTEGQKLSKRLNNYADPLELFDNYGADALRVTMLSSSVAKGHELLIDKEGKMVYEQLRLFIKPIWNAYHFFTIYANADDIKAQIDFSSSDLLDRYILSKLQTTISSIQQALDAFDTQAAYGITANFFEILNNWYIRRSRQRFWKTQHDQEKISAYNTLYTCLNLICTSISPLLPLITEEIYLNITSATEEYGSVHLMDFPDWNKLTNGAFVYDTTSVTLMDVTRDICSCVLFIRNVENIRIRQPLASVTIIANNVDGFEIFANIIKEEVNVKDVIFMDNLDHYATRKLSINFPVLGKRLPQHVKDIIIASKQNAWQLKGNNLEIAGQLLNEEEFSLTLEPNHGIKNAKVLSNNFGLVILDLEISQTLYEEGIARDLIRLVQQARKNAGFDISDKIALQITSKGDLSNILSVYQTFIEEQTLSKIVNNADAHYVCNYNLHNIELALRLQKLC